MTATTTLPSHTAPVTGELIYRFEAELTALNLVGHLPEGLLFSNPFEGRITDGPLAGGRVWGVDTFLLRPDGTGVIDAPETLSLGDLHITGAVRGYTLPPAGLVTPPLEQLLSSDFVWPSVPFAVRATATFRTGTPDLAWLNRVVALITGDVTMQDRRLRIEARVY